MILSCYPIQIAMDTKLLTPHNVSVIFILFPASALDYAYK